MASRPRPGRGGAGAPRLEPRCARRVPRGGGARSRLGARPRASICLFLEERFAPARAAATQTAREQSHVEAVALLVGGRPGEAERLMVKHLETWPQDVVVLQRLYFVWFWQGRFPEILALTTRQLPPHGDESFVLGLHAFALEQAHHCREAVQAAETAMAATPGTPGPFTPWPTPSTSWPPSTRAWIACRPRSILAST